jgi:hypothetical protein
MTLINYSNNLKDIFLNNIKNNSINIQILVMDIKNYSAILKNVINKKNYNYLNYTPNLKLP